MNFYIIFLFILTLLKLEFLNNSNVLFKLKIIKTKVSVKTLLSFSK